MINYGDATVTLANSTVSGNSAGSDGGGVRNSGTLTLTNSTVSGNSAFDDGGGVFTYGGTLTLDQSLVSGNSASSQGPEVFNSAGERGPATSSPTVSTSSGTMVSPAWMALRPAPPTRPISCRPFP